MGDITAVGAGNMVNNVQGGDQEQTKKVNDSSHNTADANKRNKELNTKMANTMSMLAIGEMLGILKDSPSKIEVDKAIKEIFSESSPTAQL